jgi:hypothetical protein
MPSNNVKSHKDLYSENTQFHADLNKKLCLLYEGGFSIQQQASLFLEQMKGLETPQAYQSRLKAAAYIPYLSEFITQFAASLFSEELEVKEPADANDPDTEGVPMQDDVYKQFLEDCDMNGTSLHQFMHSVFEHASYELGVYVGTDFPLSDGLITSRYAEKEAKSDRPYLYTIPYSQVVDWKKDDNGRFIWVKLFEEVFPNDDPFAQNTHCWRITIWRMLNGVAHWEVWQSKPEKMKDKKNILFYQSAISLEYMPPGNTLLGGVPATTTYKLTSEGDTSFKKIPLHCFCVPPGYHLGRQLGVLCQEHYQRRSFMVSNANKTCVALGTMTLGPDVTAPGDSLPPDIPVPETSNALRGKLESDGWIVLRKTDKWFDEVNIVEAKGESHKFIADDLKHLVEQMMQVIRQMNMTATAQTKALGRSAASKMVDQHGTSMLLSVYEKLVKDYVRELLTCIAAGRNEDIKFSISGLSIAEPYLNREDLVDEVMKLGIPVMKLPHIFKSKYLFRIATDLLDNDLSEREKMELHEKIIDAVEAGQFNELPPPAPGTGGAQDMQNAKTVPSQKAPPKPASPMDGNDPMTLGPSGQPLLPEGAHLQTGENIDPQEVFDHLAQDYNDKDIQWVLHLPWTGPRDVPLTSIDFSNKDNWQAAQPSDQEHVDMFAEKMQNDNMTKPIILVNAPSADSKMMIVDGHHRALAALQNGTPVPAYIGEVGRLNGPWKALHSKQVGKKQGSGMVASSQQKNLDQSIQKQVDKSENAVDGQTK